MTDIIKYVLQREDGAFYYKGSGSSIYGYSQDFSEAFLFKTELGAKSRSFTANPLSVKVRKVKITLLNE